MDSKLRDFLESSKKLAEHLDTKARVHAVLGNEACDLDSVVSSIIYAFHLQAIKLSSSHESSQSQDVIVPILNIPRADYPLRTEISYTMDKFGVSSSDLVFINEIDLPVLLKSGRLAVTLVDHNILAQDQTDLINVLVEVIDHHKDELPTSSSYTKTIEPVGSCSTLVAEKILTSNPSLLDKQVTSLLLSSIILDTVNLDERAGRMTPKDVEIVKHLEIGQELGFSTGDLYHLVNKAKFDISNLTSMDILRKDYKAVPPQTGSSMRVGISSIALSLENFFSREQIADTLKEFCNLKGLNTLVVMAMFFQELDGPPLRQICVCGSAQDSVLKLARYMISDRQLQLSDLDLGMTGCFCFNQLNVKASRKVVFPLVMSFS